jgi:hypothetical protein
MSLIPFAFIACDKPEAQRWGSPAREFRGFPRHAVGTGYGRILVTGRRENLAAGLSPTRDTHRAFRPAAVLVPPLRNAMRAPFAHLRPEESGVVIT